MKERITLQDTGFDVIVKMVEGNPGATTVCAGIMSRGAEIDPDAFMGGIGTIMWLDTLKVYGPRIWMLFKDVCGEDLVKMLGVLRAVQLGYLGHLEFNHAIDNCGDGIDVDDLLSQVQERLPDFGKEL